MQQERQTDRNPGTEFSKDPPQIIKNQFLSPVILIWSTKHKKQSWSLQHPRFSLYFPCGSSEKSQVCLGVLSLSSHYLRCLTTSFKADTD